MFKPSRVDAFDRVKFRLTGPLSPKQLAELKRHSRRIAHEGVNTPYAPTSPYVLEVSQPHATFFPLLLRTVGTSVGIEPAYAEVARDYTTRFQIEADRMLEYFLQTATLRHSPRQITKFEATIYFGGRMQTRWLALYADKRSKLYTPALGMYCLHTEVRLRGSPALRSQGLGTLSDFIGFSFDAFWHRNVRFWQFGSRSLLGRLLNGNESISEESARARTRRMFRSQQYLLGHMFVLQKAAFANPKMLRALERIDEKEWEQRARHSALSGTLPGKR